MLFNKNSIKNTKEEDVALLIEINEIFFKMQDIFSSQKTQPRFSYSFRCHSICRALAWKFKGRVSLVDGHFLSIKIQGNSFEIISCRHSWLLTENGSIIDPYPIGMIVMSPILFVKSGSYKEFSEGHYFPDKKVLEEVAQKDISMRKLWRESRNPLRLMS